MNDAADSIDAILATRRVSAEDGEEIGRSREGRPVRAFRFGSGSKRVSLLGGCHADEPVGPRLLRHLCGYLGDLPADAPLLAAYDWWIIPHINPDGEARNRAWHSDADEAFDPVAYLKHVIRELPGDDIEFGFPTGEGDTEARPENRAAFEWWRSAREPFRFHASLHGTAIGAGPWFLIEPAWRRRCDVVKHRCSARVAGLGYELHDVERCGEKGFFRIERGFCTRPDSRHMRRHFRELGDERTAALFRPSSMETIRSFGGDPLTLVSEMPLFITPGVGRQLGPPDPAAVAWRERIEGWRAASSGGEDADRALREARRHGMRSMPVRDQMVLQWTMIEAGLEQLEAARELPS